MKKWSQLFVLCLSLSVTAVHAENLIDAVNNAENKIRERYPEGSRARTLANAKLDAILNKEMDEGGKIQEIHLAFPVEHPATTAKLLGDSPHAPSQMVYDAFNGDAHRQAELATNLLNTQPGYHTPEAQEAIKWAKLASDKGNTAAMVKLGTYYYANGNVNEAESWLNKAAAKNDSEAFFMLGKIAFEDGNIKSAVSFYMKAVALNNAKAEYEMGQIYWSGVKDIPRDIPKAQMYFRKAARQGHLDAKECYINIKALQEDQAATQKLIPAEKDPDKLTPQDLTPPNAPDADPGF